MNATNTKYYIYFIAYKSNWEPSAFNESDFICYHVFKQTKNNLFWYNAETLKNEKCINNLDVEIYPDDKITYNKKCYEINKESYNKIIDFINAHPVGLCTSVLYRFRYYKYILNNHIKEINII